MIKRSTPAPEDLASDFSANLVAPARLRRQAKTSSPRASGKRRALAKGRRKNSVVGGMHQRGNKRTVR